MDEPVSLLVAERRRDEQWIDTLRVAEDDLDFSPKCGNAQQLLDSSFGLELELAEALGLRMLRMDFQPQFDLGSGRGCGVEALARWVRSTGEVVAPSVFIRIAERADMIHSLGAWVLHSSCATASAWCSRAAQPTTLSVNVSALQIDEEFFSVIEQTLKQTGFPAKQLELEITESALIANLALSIEHQSVEATRRSNCYG
jgi:EAL domain-containing protein (putative c-di-GMP-specific phosphodiesterase class I)